MGDRLSRQRSQFFTKAPRTTSLKVNPEPIVLDLTDQRLSIIPSFILSNQRSDLQPTGSGGVKKILPHEAMVDDFGRLTVREPEARAQTCLSRPRSPGGPLSHEIFQCVYPMKEKPQVPAINAAYATRDEGLIVGAIQGRQRYEHASLSCDIR